MQISSDVDTEYSHIDDFFRNRSGRGGKTIKTGNLELISIASSIARKVNVDATDNHPRGYPRSNHLPII